MYSIGLLLPVSLSSRGLLSVLQLLNYRCETCEGLCEVWRGLLCQSASLSVNILHSCCSCGSIIRQHRCHELERISSVVSNIDVSVGSDEDTCFRVPFTR